MITLDTQLAVIIAIILGVAGFCFIPLSNLLGAVLTRLDAVRSGLRLIQRDLRRTVNFILSWPAHGPGHRALPTITEPEFASRATLVVSLDPVTWDAIEDFYSKFDVISRNAGAATHNQWNELLAAAVRAETMLWWTSVKIDQKYSWLNGIAIGLIVIGVGLIVASVIWVELIFKIKPPS